MNNKRSKGVADAIIGIVLEHSRVVGIKDYSGNAEIEIFDDDVLRRKICSIIEGD